jgi:hypothetical protein
MTTYVTTLIHFDAADLGHRHQPGIFTSLDIGDTVIHFTGGSTDLVDATIAELVALRAEMTGEPEPSPAPEPGIVCIRFDDEPRRHPCCEHCPPVCDGEIDGHGVTCGACVDEAQPASVTA